MDNPDISYPVAKASAALGAAGAVHLVNLTQWFQFGAAVLAFVYSAIVMIEWVVKKFRRKGGRGA